MTKGGALLESDLRSFAEIRPFVRFAGQLSLSPADCAGTRIACDHRLFYVTGPAVRFRVRGRGLSLKQGGVLAVLSGTPYRILPGENISLMIVNFDFFHPEGREVPAYPMPMSAPEDFSPEMRIESFRFAENVFPDGYAALEGRFELLPHLETLAREYSRGELLCAVQMSALLTLCLGQIFRALRQTAPQRGPDAHRDILEYLSDHLAEELTNRSVAEAFHYHPNYVSAIVRAQTGLSMHRYLQRLRVCRAAELLLAGGCSVRGVAAQCGFPDASYFSQCFRRCIGCPPSAFRGRDTDAASGSR